MTAADGASIPAVEERLTIRAMIFEMGIGLVALAVSIQHAAAAGFVLDPQCRGFRDPIACTCFLQNGGWLGVRGGRRVVFKSPNDQLIDSINNCTIAGRAAAPQK